MKIRGKVALIYLGSSLAGPTLLWLVNIFYSLRDWSQLTVGLGSYLAIVLGLLAVGIVTLLLITRAIGSGSKYLARGESLSPKLKQAISKELKILPRFFIGFNAIAFFVGPLVQNILKAMATGVNPINVATLTSVILSTSIGLYTAFVVIRLSERSTLPLRFAIETYELDKFPKGRWRKRQAFLSFSIFYLLFGLLFTSGFGYVREDVFAPAQVDVSSGATAYTSQKQTLWTQALSGEQVDINVAEGYAAIRLGEYSYKLLILGAIAAALAVFAVILDAAPNEKRLASLSARLQGLSGHGEGSIDQNQIPLIRDDEIEQAVHWINKLLVFQQKRFSTVQEVGERVSSTSAAIALLSDSAKEIVGALKNATSAVDANLQVQEQSLEEAAKGVMSLVQGGSTADSLAQEQNTAVGTSSSAIEEMTASIASVSSSAVGASQRVHELVTIAGDGAQQMSQLFEEIANIEQKANDVSRSLGDISKIAAQTNLLAMNAAIEAAHAGDAGRGFAVVADEVRQLSESATKATKTIAQVIKDMTRATNQGVERSKSAEAMFNKIRSAVEETNQVLSTIASAMEEQKHGSMEVQDAMHTLLELSAKTAEGTTEQKHQSTVLSENVERMMEAVQVIAQSMEEETRTIAEVEQFTEKLRASIEQNEQIVRALEASMV